MGRLFCVALAAIAVGLPAAAGGAHAAVPCRDRIYNDWYADGKIASTYPLGCYRDALAHVGSKSDVTIYSSLADDIRSALQAAIARRHGHHVAAQVGRGFTAPSSVSLTTTPPHDPTPPATQTSSPQRTPTVPAIETNASSAVSNGSGGLPMPLLVLGGLALLLVAAGLVGGGTRYYRTRGTNRRNRARSAGK